MKPSRIQAVDNVNIEAPLGLEESLRWFYGEVAQLDEVPCATATPSRLCFKSEQIELRIHLVERPEIEAVACRVTVALPSLTDAAELLAERSMLCEHQSGISMTYRRLQTLDPAGNRVEFKQESRVGPF